MKFGFTRRSIATGLGFGGLLSSTAIADTPFTQFSFPATGAPASRTMPNRLAEIKNVRDFGAVGDGGTDDWAAIQAAIDSTSGANRGIIFFPPGRYYVYQPLTFNYDGDLSIAFVGVSGSEILGNNFNDFVFKRTLGTPNNTKGGRIFEKLRIINPGATGGCIQLGSTDGAYIRDCIFGGHICVTTEDSAGNSSTNVLFENCLFRAQGTAAGSHGVIIGGSGAMMGCDSRNIDTGVRIYGKGFHAVGNRTENCNTAWLLGLDSIDVDQGASGFSIASCTTEGNGTAIDFAGTCSGFTISSFGATGHTSDNSGYPTGVQDSQYGIRVRADKATAGVFESVGASSSFEHAAISVANATSRAGLVFIGCTAAQAGSLGVAWDVPTNAQTAQFVNCQGVQPVYAYSQLPSGGNVFEGDEFNISDSNTAAWGVTAAGSGSNHVLVRWNGSNWTVVGK